MNRTNTKLVLAIVAALVMSPAIGGPETEQPHEAAAAHKSYANDRYGFSFEYPASWELVEKHEAQSGAALLTLKLLSPDENIPVRRDYSPGSVSIEVFSNSKQQPLREWLDANGWPFEAADRSVTSTALGGLPALEVSTGRMFAPNRFTYVANKTWVLRLSAVAPDSHTVLQSFRFKP